MNRVEVLIISNSKDFTTDFICIELEKRKSKYLRINRDLFSSYSIYFDIGKLYLKIGIDQKEYSVSEESLKSIYYRAPIYLHYVPKKVSTFEEQLFQTQWMSFLRNLLVFEKVKWMNNPISTFRSENKMVQLKHAKECGFICPKTLLVNDISDTLIQDDQEYVVKSVDTVILREGNREAFSYTNILKGSEIKNSELALSPVVIQDYIYPKIDIRVTVVKETLFAVQILKNGKGLDGDWRKEKERVEFIPIELPLEIQKACIDITQNLGLVFGGIDLALSNEKYYFIEINPTGEWAWLVKRAGCAIDLAICNYLNNN